MHTGLPFVLRTHTSTNSLPYALKGCCIGPMHPILSSMNMPVAHYMSLLIEVFSVVCSVSLLVFSFSFLVFPTGSEKTASVQFKHFLTLGIYVDK